MFINICVINNLICFSMFIIIFDIKSIFGLKGVQLNVPRAVRAGHSVTLGCDYDLEQAALYSVKWYHGDTEFYRYVPKEEPPTRVFDVLGINVDIAVSNAHTVTLLSVQRGISGVYKCEVSADAPYFHTDIKSALMTVVEIPNGIPVVTVDRLRFAQGGPLIADCTAPPSSPATNLTWFVNDQRVPGSTAKSITKSRNSSLEIASSRLELSTADPTTHPQLGPIRLRCEATLFKIFKVTSIEIDIKPNSPPLLSASVLGHSNNHFSGSTRTTFIYKTNLIILLYIIIPLILTIENIIILPS